MAAPASNHLDNTEPLALDCAICLVPFHHTTEGRRPRILPCGHSFCETDLHQLLKDNMIWYVHTNAEMQVECCCNLTRPSCFGCVCSCPTCRHQAAVNDLNNEIKLN